MAIVRQLAFVALFLAIVDNINERCIGHAMVLGSLMLNLRLDILVLLLCLEKLVQRGGVARLKLLATISDRYQCRDRSSYNCKKLNGPQDLFRVPKPGYGRGYRCEFLDARL